MDNQIKGSNGLVFIDNGDTWRAIGDETVINPKEMDILDSNDRFTGIRYGIGMSKKYKKGKIAYVDYPKDVYDIEDLTTDPHYVEIQNKCNVCHAMNRMQELHGINPLDDSAYSSQPVQSLQPVSQPQPVERMSIGNVAGSLLAPKYVAAGLTLLKPMVLSDFGDAVISFAASFLADLAAGSKKDESSKRALYALSDLAIDSMAGGVMLEGNPEDQKRFVAAVKYGAADVMDSVRKDGDFINAIKRNMLRSGDSLRKEAASMSEHRPEQSGNQYSAPSGDMSVIYGGRRVFE